LFAVFVKGVLMPRYLLLAAAFLSTQGFAAQRIMLDPLDTAKIASEDASSAGKLGRPFRYAISKSQSSGALGAGIDASRETGWSRTKDGLLKFEAEVYAPGAKSLDAWISPFRLPHGATLKVQNADGSYALPIYTDADNPQSKVLPLPVVPGDTLRLTLTLPESAKPYLQFKLAGVNQGYRGFDFSSGGAIVKAGGCNVDVACPQADPYRNEIRAVLHYSVAGGLCTGSLINNTSGDRSPLFITANHCLETASEASQVVAYHNFQSATCRALSGSSINSPRPASNTAQLGATLLATTGRSDVTLLRLTGALPAGANPYYLGWDRRDQASSGAFCIHHPNGDEKRISFENNPTRVTNFTFTAGPINLIPGTGLEVPNWDIGTTEEGSSGSALMDLQTRRVIGTLSGGGAACAGTTNNGERDVYGRIFTGWEGGGATNSRLRDHLDPGNTGAQFTEGLANCNAPTVQLTVSGALNADSDISFATQVSGGTAPYRYEWDFDGDGITDRSSGEGTLSTRYNRPLSINASVRVVDAASCSRVVTRALDISGHDVRMNATRGPEQICGDGDTSFDPGERWRIVGELTNSSTATSAQALAQFAAGTAGGGSGALSNADAGGYRYSDSAASCPKAFVDMSAQPALTLTPSRPGFTANDDGRTAVINLGANAFEFYGTQVSSIILSTNGYFTLNPSAGFTGEDFEPNCGNNPAADSGKRIRPLHADLSVASVKALALGNCPRPSTVGAANQSCIVLEWNQAEFLDSSFNATPGKFDMQALIYPQTKQIVFQYRGVLNPTFLPEAVSGLMNDASPAFNYQCLNQGPASASVDRAVCFFAAGNQPQTGVSTSLVLTKPTSSIGALASGATTTASAEIAIPANAACGSSSSVSFIGVADERSHSTIARDLPVNIPAACNVVNNCPVPASVALRGGSFYNRLRSGNGLVAFVIPRTPPALPAFFGAWFTGEKNRSPTWYIVQGDIQGNSSNASIFRLKRTSDSPFTTASTEVGTAQISMLEREKMLFSYQFTSGSEAGTRGIELMQHLLRGLAPAAPDITGHYYNQSQSGWGQTYESYVQNGTASQFILSYLYDAAGNPRWIVAQEPDSLGTLPASALQVHCPSCSWLDAGPTGVSVGTLTRQFQGFGNGTVGLQINLPAPYAGPWTRSNFAIEALSVPNQ
jgi:lysyl endopeptidase